jgi:putative transposase
VYLTGQGLKFEATNSSRGRGVVILPKLEGDLARLKLRGGRWPNGHINSARLKLHNDKLYLSVQWDGPAPIGRKPMPTPQPGPVLGVDLGLADLVVESDGTKHAAPKLLRQREDQLANLQRRFSRQDRKEKLAKTRRRSNRQRRRQQKIARLHRQVRNRRQDHLHQLSHALITKARVIGLETLGIKAMARGRHAKSVHDAGWGELVRQLDYKTEWHGRELRRMGRFDRSTGCCPDCRTVGPRLEEDIREWICAACGVIHDRDIASARWIALHAKATPQGIAGDAGSVARRRGLGLRRKRACKPAAEAEGAANVHRLPFIGDFVGGGVESE